MEQVKPAAPSVPDAQHGVRVENDRYAIFKYLEKAKQAGDCSLNDGVRLMAADNRVRALDIGDAWWQDVDTPDMLRHAEQRMKIAG